MKKLKYLYLRTFYTVEFSEKERHGYSTKTVHVFKLKAVRWRLYLLFGLLLPLIVCVAAVFGFFGAIVVAVKECFANVDIYNPEVHGSIMKDKTAPPPTISEAFEEFRKDV